MYFYRSQRSCEGYIFTRVCLSTGGSTWAASPLGPDTPPRTRYTPWEQVHPPGSRYNPRPGTPPWDQVHPLGPGTTPDQVHPPGPRTPPGTRYTPPGSRYPPGVGTPPRDGYCCGRYASYWNAFLFFWEDCSCYRSQGKVMFSEASVCPRGWVGLPLKGGRVSLQKRLCLQGQGGLPPGRGGGVFLQG